MARPSHQPSVESRARVRALAMVGTPQEDISAAIGISHPTLRKYYREELRLGTIDANAKVAGALFTNATKHNNVVAQIFWLKSRAGWSEHRPDADDDGAPPKPQKWVLGVVDGRKPDGED